MAVPAYTTDLTRIVDFDNDTPTMAEPTGWLAGRQPVSDDTDYPIQSVTHGSLVMNTTGKAGMVATGPTRTWTSGHYLFGWIIWLAPGAISTQALGGLVMIAGSSSSVQKIFYVGGNDFGSYPYGGWQNFAVDPELTADETNGTATDFYVVGGGANVLTAVAKGSPLGMDVFRYGRGEFRVAGGEAANYANFAGMAATNDATAARWGQFQAVEGGYRSKGLTIWGYATAVNFVDSNVDIVIENTEYVNDGFNGLEIRNTSSVIDTENVKITQLGTTAPWTLEMVDNANVTLTTWTFVDTGTTTLLSNGSLLGCTWRGCDQIDHGGANLSGSSISGYEGTAGTAAMTYNVNADPDGEMDGMTFTKGTAATAAIELLPNCPSTITLNDWTVIDYSATNGNNDSVIYNNSGKAILVNTSGNTGVISYRNGTSASTTVQNTVTTTIKDVPTGAEWRLYEKDATTGIIGSVELDGAESHAGGDITYADNYSSDTDAALQVLASGYEEYLRYFILGSAPQTINVILITEENT